MVEPLLMFVNNYNMRILANKPLETFEQKLYMQATETLRAVLALSELEFLDEFYKRKENKDDPE